MTRRGPAPEDALTPTSRRRPRWPGWLTALLMAALVPAGPAHAQEVPYTVEIVGVPDDDLRETLAGVSSLVADAERPPPTLPALRRRAEADVPVLEEALASFGYYGAVVGFDVDETAQPVRVALGVELGPPYRLDRYDITAANPALGDGQVALDADTLGLKRGDVALAAKVLESEQRVLAALAAQGYPLARIVDRQVIVDHAAQTMSVALRLDTGPPATFGGLRIHGLETLDPRVVQRRLRWRDGERFDARKVEAGRKALVETGLFASVRMVQAAGVEAGGNLPITVEVVEAKRRSVGVGLSYATSEGPGGKVTWEHRNLMGRGENLTLALEVGTERNGLTGQLRETSLRDPRLTYVTSAGATYEELDAYDSYVVGGAGGVEYAFTDILTGSAGLSFEHIEIDEGATDSTFDLVGIPLSLIVDTTSDLLDPTYGNRLTLSATPYISTVSGDANFVVLSLGNSVYVPLDEERRIVTALWGRVGSILGEDTLGVPATKRFYAGGSGSVRAYGFEELGPQDADGDPVGGRAVAEGGTELRWRVTDDWGGVAFLEAGNVFDDAYPDPGKRFQVGAGFGVRYFTPFGPIRADIAFPLNPRDNDDVFQFYVGLGQAF